MRNRVVVFALTIVAIGPAAWAGQGPSSPRMQMPRQGTPMPPRDTSARPRAAAPEIGTASISGRVMAAESGLPLRHAIVTALPTRAPAPQERGRAATRLRGLSARTDDEGRYTIVQVPEGEYSLMARRSGYVEQSFGQLSARMPGRRVAVAEGAAMGPMDFQLQRGGVITGRVVDDAGEPAERVTVRAVSRQRVGRQTRLAGGTSDQTDDQGHFRLFGLSPGEYLVMAAPNDRRGWFGGDQVQGVETDVVATYGPGTVNPAEAMAVQVEPGLEAAMDVQLVAAKVAAIRGRVLTSAGEPLEGGFVRLQVAEGGVTGGGMDMGRGGPIQADGRFDLEGVPPGTYTVIAQAMMGRGRGGPGGPVPEVGSQTIVVEGEDIALMLTTSPGSTVKGRVSVDGDASALANREVQVTAMPLSSSFGPGFAARGRLTPAGTFELSGVRGLQALRFQSLPEGWWVKDVRVAGQQALDGFDFGNGQAFTGVEVVLSSKPTGLIGSVTLPTGAVASDYTVVLFTQDEAMWEETGPGRTSTVRLVRPGLDGAFKMQGLRPGDYFVLALPAEQAEFQTVLDPDQLRGLAGRARTVEVKDGQMASLTLTLVTR